VKCPSTCTDMSLRRSLRHAQSQAKLNAGPTVDDEDLATYLGRPSGVHVPRNAYILFRVVYSKKHSGQSQHAAAEAWARLPESERKQYYDFAEQERKAYAALHPEGKPRAGTSPKKSSSKVTASPSKRSKSTAQPARDASSHSRDASPSPVPPFRTMPPYSTLPPFSRDPEPFDVRDFPGLAPNDDVLETGFDSNEIYPFEPEYIPFAEDLNVHLQHPQYVPEFRKDYYQY